MSNLKTQLQEAIFQAAKKFSPQLKLEQVQLDHPENDKFGDYSTNLAMVLAKKARKKPLDLAKLIVKELKNNRTIEQFNNITIASPGFINFFLKTDYLLKELGRVDKDYAQGQDLKGKKIMVEFCHPNTHKQFHIGHLRNICLGESIVRLLEYQGAEIIRANYQGDVGLHIAKCLYGIWQAPNYKHQITNLKTITKKVEFLGKAYAAGNKAYEKDPQAKKEILTINKKIYAQSDPEINQLWKKTRQWSLDYFETIYKRVYSHYDRYYFEGEVYQAGKKIVLEGLKKKIFKKSKGAIIFPGSKYGLHDRVFITAEGNPTYEAKDMELGRLQFSEHHPDLIIHVVGPEQAGYFKVVFKALALLFPQTKDKEYHLVYGWVRLKKGKMSSRSGNVVTGSWLLDEAKKRIKKDYPDLDEKRAEMISVAAVKYSFLKVNPQTEVAFDFDESISLQGNSGPYLQYTYARAQSVLCKAKKPYTLRNTDYSLNPEELAVLRTFYKFPEIVKQTSQDYSPNLLCNFLYDLAQKYNVFYNRHRILNPTMKQCSNVTMFRILLTEKVSKVLYSGLYLLAIKTPRKM